MAVIRTFPAVRPLPALAAKVAALPYDVMSSKEASVMACGNPYSFLYVDKAEIDLPEGTPIYDSSVYEKASENLNKMIEEGTLIQDKKPMLYIYRLSARGRSQTGLVACLSLDEYISGSIKRHELTREDKEQDRIRHIEACNANTGPIFLAYRQKREIDALINRWAEENPPVYDFVSEDGVGHQAWMIDDSDVCDAITRQFEQVPCLYIADGHHRNASAVKVGLERRRENPDYNKDAEFNYYLSVLFPDDQLHIMEYNRLVKSLNDMTIAEFMERVRERFFVEEEGAQPERPHQFGMYMGGKWLRLTIKPEFIKEGDPVEALDVSLLQNVLLNPVLGIADPRTDRGIDFVGGIRGLDGLTQRVDSGEMALAFTLYPVSMEELMAISDAGSVMPPKSTWFEPKLRSGLFIHLLN